MTEVLTRGRLDLERTTNTTDDDGLTGWWAVATSPWECTTCGRVENHMTAMHKIVVWPAQDDRDLLHHAARARDVGRNPKVVEYERSMGPSISYYELMRDSDRFQACSIRKEAP